MMRIGNGWDRHALTEDRKLILGGVEIPHEKGLLGHSDADVLIHSVIDALLGAAALGDIGGHFPETTDNKNIDSMLLLAKTVELLQNAGYDIINIDSIIMAERPQLGPYIPEMRANLSHILGIDIGQISVKAKTGEGLGEIGQCLSMEAYTIALIQKRA